MLTDDAVIVIAHSGDFDRKFAERYWPIFERNVPSRRTTLLHHCLQTRAISRKDSIGPGERAAVVSKDAARDW
jgi:hypothetical protein